MEWRNGRIDKLRKIRYSMGRGDRRDRGCPEKRTRRQRHPHPHRLTGSCTEGRRESESQNRDPKVGDQLDQRPTDRRGTEKGEAGWVKAHAGIGRNERLVKRGTDANPEVPTTTEGGMTPAWKEKRKVAREVEGIGMGN